MNFGTFGRFLALWSKSFVITLYGNFTKKQYPFFFIVERKVLLKKIHLAKVYITKGETKCCQSELKKLKRKKE